MNVDRLSVTVPSQLGEALRALAEKQETTVSALVTDAIAQRLRFEALSEALADADRRFGPVPADRVDAAETMLLKTGARVGTRRASTVKSTVRRSA